MLLSAWVLGPVYGGVAAGTGSMLADLFSGYAHYAPGTFLIKLCMAVAAALIFRFLRNRPASKLLLAQGASGLVAEAVMVAGYFGYSCLWLGKGLAAAASIAALPFPVIPWWKRRAFLCYKQPIMKSPTGWNV